VGAKGLVNKEKRNKMWMMTKIGFFSIVEKPKGVMCIRSRVKRDLEALRELLPGTEPIIRTAQADYRYRTFIERGAFVRAFHLLACLVDYKNFKEEVKKTNPRREKLYHKVWADLLVMESEDNSNATLQSRR
jgi:hypothetical protein